MGRQAPGSRAYASLRPGPGGPPWGLASPEGLGRTFRRGPKCHACLGELRVKHIPIEIRVSNNKAEAFDNSLHYLNGALHVWPFDSERADIDLRALRPF